jgi:DNA-3-methyladenine glycosylase I
VLAARRLYELTVASKTRCAWPGHDSLYIDHHDREWGVPVHDGRALWEHLVLDGFQAGLSWLTVLRKRENFRVAFAHFDPERVARFGQRDLERLLKDPGIIRSRAKINAAINNARAFLKLRDAGHDFAAWVWSFTNGAPVQNAWKNQRDVPAATPLAIEIASALKEKGFKFVGPSMVYAWMQAVGVVNDHIVSCFRYSEVKLLARNTKRYGGGQPLV